jgi:hypothetical protein
MNRPWIESHLAIAERHVAESREQVSRQKLTIAKLEIAGHRSTVSAEAARKLLQSLQIELEQYIADRNRLRRWLEKTPRAGSTAHVMAAKRLAQ